MGNVVSGDEICSDFKNKLQELEGFTEDLYKQIIKMLKKRLEYLKRRGVSPAANIKGNCIFKSFTHYKSKDYPGTKMIDIMFGKKQRFLLKNGINYIWKTYAPLMQDF